MKGYLRTEARKENPKAAERKRRKAKAHRERIGKEKELKKKKTASFPRSLKSADN